MPRELPELVGEPLGWDMFKVLDAEHAEVKIEKAISINDICPKLGEDHEGQEQVLLCFFDHKYSGPSVAFLSIIDMEHKVLSQAVQITMVTMSSIHELNELAFLFLDRIISFYGGDRNQLLKVITENAI